MTPRSEQLLIKHLDRIATALEKICKHQTDPIGQITAKGRISEILDEAMNGVKEIYEDGNQNS